MLNKSIIVLNTNLPQHVIVVNNDDLVRDNSSIMLDCIGFLTDYSTAVRAPRYPDYDTESWKYPKHKFQIPLSAIAYIMSLDDIDAD